MIYHRPFGTDSAEYGEDQEQFIVTTKQTLINKETKMYLNLISKLVKPNCIGSTSTDKAAALHAWPVIIDYLKCTS